MTNSGQNALARKNGAILMAKSATWSLSININKPSIPIYVTVYLFSNYIFFLE
jgi:hypothetical protein